MKNSFLVIALGLAVMSCKKKQTDVKADYDDKAIISNHIAIVTAMYEDSYVAVQNLQNEVNSFTNNPSENGLKNLKTAYTAARIPYLKTEALRFSGGPIDDDLGKEGRINGWPLDESYVDYTKTDDTTGIINSKNKKYAVINKDSLIAWNETTDVSLTLGFHVIEFLVWGQDDASSIGGNRAFTDYTTAKNASRRKEFLKAITQILVDDIAHVKNEWAVNGAYRTKLMAMPTVEGLKIIFKGIVVLSNQELPVERMRVAVLAQDQEQEHSCFSDQTDQDIKLDVKGISIIYTGTYQRTNGQMITGANLKDYILHKNADIGNKTITQIQLAEQKSNLIQVPFDKEIIGAATDAGPKRVYDASNSIVDMSAQLIEAAAVLGIKDLL